MAKHHLRRFPRRRQDPRPLADHRALPTQRLERLEAIADLAVDLPHPIAAAFARFTPLAHDGHPLPAYASESEVFTTSVRRSRSTSPWLDRRRVLGSGGRAAGDVIKVDVPA